MLKRTLGRSLVTLLVITGLAGTVNNNTLSKKERKYAVTMMKETRTDLLNKIKGLTAGQLDYRAAAGKWSVKECIYHIAATEKALWSLLENSLKGVANPEKRAEIKITDEEFVNRIKDRSTKFQAAEPLQPPNTGYKSALDAIEDFSKNRTEHIKYMKSSTEDLRNHVVQLPFGWIDCYQLSLMVAAHSNRHTQQIIEVMEDPGFPKQ